MNRPLHLVRNGIVLACTASLCAAGVVWAVRNPGGAVPQAVLALADAPRFVAATLANVTGDRFALSRTPDEFGAIPGYRPVANHSRHRIEGLVVRTDAAHPPRRGWRILYGIFQIDGAPAYAALALSPAFAIEHVWMVGGGTSGDAVTPFEPAPYPHGFALLRDGSILAGFDSNYRTVRVGWCGDVRWTSPAYLNHSISPTDDGRFAWGVAPGDTIQKIDIATGRIVRTIDMAALRRANPDVSALDMLRINDNELGENSRTSARGSHPDPYHLNDVDPLPAALATRFPQFRAGDLLLSFRSINLVAVVDPGTLRIKWLTNDHSFRQHDPDWSPMGEISLLDNRMGQGFSRIIAFDPATGGHRTIVDGARLNFHTRIRGKHQPLPDGGTLITSSGQGRVLEVDRQGRVTASILNHDPRTSGRNLLISETLLLPTPSPLFEKARPCAD
ncbi:arylsulfotransferase family protein [Sphingobium sufflavum]|uniref:arylsulfotransferase family protein n=1 Tax=Sphingobium sufflavum TaxID=1129547 RepID=UPI001F434BC6|nr:arylsulfotransferase family protein [Sphingobium sufflavum]MCE7795986.1 arylsulfotransferase family protein [Sphingobium sufflavum]